MAVAPVHVSQLHGVCVIHAVGHKIYCSLSSHRRQVAPDTLSTNLLKAAPKLKIKNIFDAVRALTR